MVVSFFSPPRYWPNPFPDRLEMVRFSGVGPDGKNTNQHLEKENLCITKKICIYIYINGDCKGVVPKINLEYPHFGMAKNKCDQVIQLVTKIYPRLLEGHLVTFAFCHSKMRILQIDFGHNTPPACSSIKEMGSRQLPRDTSR